MPNWDRTPQVSGLTVKEMKQRVKDGIANRRKTGELPPADLKMISTTPDGAIFTNKQRRMLIQASNLAIYALANGDKEDYCGSVEVINSLRRQAGFETSFMQAMCDGIADQAAELTGDTFEIIDQLARQWLAEYFTPSGKVISITKGNNSGNSEKQTKH